MLWQNDNAIIVGKHQNTLAEINLDYVKEHDIKVVRRLSGGGAVYHDMGNLNFTFTRSSERDDDLVDFKRYTAPIIAVLQDMGVNAEFSGRNDIMIEGKKFSGNAEHVFKNKVMHQSKIQVQQNEIAWTFKFKLTTTKLGNTKQYYPEERSGSISRDLMSFLMSR